MSIKTELEKAELESIQLYNDLLALASKSDTFFHTDQIGADGATYRIFLYRLASYSDWLNAGAMESRGIMFRLNDAGDMQELVSRPMEKFFNMGEMLSDINTLATVLIKQGRLSQNVWDRVKNKDSTASD